MKSFLVALFGLVLLLLSGCGSQDRYHVVEPPLFMEIQDGNFSTTSWVPSLYHERYSYETAEVHG